MPGMQELIKLLEKAAEKATSGRYFLTVICGLTFAWLAVKGKLEVAAALVVITSVFKDYFGRDDRTPPAGGAA